VDLDSSLQDLIALDLGAAAKENTSAADTAIMINAPTTNAAITSLL